MLDAYLQFLPFGLFPVAFVGLWLAVGSLVIWISGWYGLMDRFPDRHETPLTKLTWQSGMMGRARLRGVLTLSACPTGLRLSIMKVFAPFARDVFVPWSEIEVTRKDWFLGKVAELKLGRPASGSLTIAASTADALAAAAQTRWPEQRRR